MHSFLIMHSCQTIPLPAIQMLSSQEWRMVNSSNMGGKITLLVLIVDIRDTEQKNTTSFMDTLLVFIARIEQHLLLIKCLVLSSMVLLIQVRICLILLSNQVSGTFIHGAVDTGQNMSNLTAQCQQLIILLNTQVQSKPIVGNSIFQLSHQAATSVSVKQPSFHASSSMASIPLCLSSFNSPNLDLLVFSSKLTEKPNISCTEWVIDTGATDHMVISTTLFTTKTIFHDVSLPLLLLLQACISVNNYHVRGGRFIRLLS